MESIPYELVVNFPESLEVILNNTQFEELMTKLTEISSSLLTINSLLTNIVYIIVAFFVWKVITIIYKLLAGWFLGGL